MHIYIFNYAGMNLYIHIRMIMACFDIMDGVALQPKNSQIKPIPCSTETEIAWCWPSNNVAIGSGSQQEKKSWGWSSQKGHFLTNLCLISAGENSRNLGSKATKKDKKVVPTSWEPCEFYLLNRFVGVHCHGGTLLIGGYTN